MKETKQSSLGFKITVISLLSIILVVLLLNIYLFLCFEYRMLDGHIDIGKGYVESVIYDDQQSGDYELLGIGVCPNGYCSYLFKLKDTIVDTGSYLDPAYLDNTVRLSVDDYFWLEGLDFKYGDKVYFNFEFTHGRLSHCYLYDKETGELVGDPSRKGWKMMLGNSIPIEETGTEIPMPN